MRVFLINLDKNKDRLRRCDAQLRKLGVDYKRYPAIYGKILSVAEKNRSVCGFLWWCHSGRRVMNGEIGCALSHEAIYRQLVENQWPCVCILEDDVILDDRFKSQLKRVEEWIDPERAQVVLLSNHSGDEGEDGQILEVTREIFTEGYVITGPAAAAILRINYPLRVAADSWNWFRRRGGVRIYHAFPAVCKQDWSDGFVSDVCTDAHGQRRGMVRGVIYKCGRLFGKVIDEVVRW